MCAVEVQRSFCGPAAIWRNGVKSVQKTPWWINELTASAKALYAKHLQGL